MEKTPVGVNPSGLTQLINNLGRDCLPDQFLREFVKNSIEAIEKTKEKKGTIIVDANWIDWHYSDQKPRPIKISFTDTGIGMAPEEMEKLISQLASSGDQKAKHVNYGVGAKISSLSRNPAGIKYESWQEGKGYMVLINYDEEQNVYCMERFQTEDGKYFNYAEIIDDVKPIEIKKHGTRVTLYGTSIKHDTMQRPEGVKGSKDFWQFFYLNQRFFRIPEGINFKVRCAYYTDLEKAQFNSKKNSIDDPVKANCLRIVRGHKFSLDRNRLKKKSGTLQLSDAKAHWWILSPERHTSSREFLLGQCGVIKDDELFHLSWGSGNKAVHFGIIFSFKDIALLIEPNENYEQDTTRRNIVAKNGSELPWEKWQHEFKVNMPEEIKKFEKEAADRLGSDKYSESLKDKLKDLLRFFKLGKYKRNPLGSIFVSEEEVESSTGPTLQGEKSDREKRPSRGGDNMGAIKEMLSLYEKRSKNKGIRVEADPYPQVEWVSLSAKTRDETEMVDRAALYIPNLNLVKANRDFGGYEAVKKNFLDTYAKTNERAPEIVTKCVEEQFTQQLMEVVAGANQLRGRQHWTQEDYEKAVSEEALTTAVSVRSNIIERANRAIRNHLRIDKSSGININ
jgi:hypothetical protein